MGRPRKYPLEFRREAAQLVLSFDRSTVQIACELGVHHKTLGNWATGSVMNVAAGARAADPMSVSDTEREPS